MILTTEAKLMTKNRMDKLNSKNPNGNKTPKTTRNRNMKYK